MQLCLPCRSAAKLQWIPIAHYLSAMHAGHKFTVPQVLMWTRREIFVFLLIGTLPTLAY